MAKWGGARVCNNQMADECGNARCVCEHLLGVGSMCVMLDRCNDDDCVEW